MTKEQLPALPFEELMETWSNEEVLENLKTLMSSLNGKVDFIYNEDDLIVGYHVLFWNEDHYYKSAPILLDWPMQHLPVPEAFKGGLH